VTVRHFCAISVYDRVKVSYLGTMLDSLEAAGGWPAEERFLVCDGGYSQGDTRDWQRFDTPSLLGVTAARWWLFRKALELGADQLTVFEDDVIFVKNAAKVMQRTVVPEGLALLSWFRTYPLPVDPPGFRLEKIAPHYWYIQGITLSRRTLRSIVNRPRMRGLIMHPSVDGAVAQLLVGQKFATASPNLIQHIGEISGAWVKGCPSLAGRGALSPTYDASFDAERLAPPETPAPDPLPYPLPDPPDVAVAGGIPLRIWEKWGPITFRHRPGLMAISPWPNRSAAWRLGSYLVEMCRDGELPGCEVVWRFHPYLPPEVHLRVP
jgi:hypothetical protein